jgi:hypothetical protein
MVLPSVILHSCMVRILGATQICALKVLDNQIVHLLVWGFSELVHLKIVAGDSHYNIGLVLGGKQPT